MSGILSLRALALRGVLAASAALCGALASGQATAQTYPDRPIKVVVGFPPGGTNDILARWVAAHLQDRLRQSVVVENKPGANSSIGNDFVAKSKPDGYTLLVSSSGGLTTNPILMKNLPYDPVRDFDPVALLGSFPLVITVPPTLPAQNFAELLQFSKTSKDGRLDHGTPTTSFVLVAETISAATGLKFNHIRYKGSGPVVASLMGGEIQVGVLDSPAVVGSVKAGKLRAIAVTSAQRSVALPDVPTLAESGLAGYDTSIWTALVAPRGTPELVLARLRSAIDEMLKDRQTIEKMHTLGLEPGNADAAALARRIEADIARWGQAARAANIQPE